MKILISTFTYPPQTGGVAEVARVQAQGLAARGHEVTVATGFDPDRNVEPTAGSPIVKQFKITGNFQRSYRGEVTEYQNFIATTPVDIILCHCWQNWATDCAMAALPRTRAKKIILSHGFDAHLWNRNSRFPWGMGAWTRSQPYVWSLSKKMDAFDRVVFLSDRRDLNRFFDHRLAEWMGKKNLSVIPNGVHLDQLLLQQPSFRERYSIESRYLLLNVANYCDRKNQIATLCAFLETRRTDATLVFIGGEFNEYSNEMKRLHEEHTRRHPEAKRRVLMLEKVPKNTIYAAYQEADLFVLSAKAETQPLVLLDAMGAGVPFISSDVGCVTEFPGGIVANGKGKTARTITDLLDAPERRHQLGEQGQTEVRANYSWKRVLDRYEDLFAQLLRK